MHYEDQINMLLNAEDDSFHSAQSDDNEEEVEVEEFKIGDLGNPSEADKSPLIRERDASVYIDASDLQLEQIQIEAI